MTCSEGHPCYCQHMPLSSYNCFYNIPSLTTSIHSFLGLVFQLSYSSCSHYHIQESEFIFSIFCEVSFQSILNSREHYFLKSIFFQPAANVGCIESPQNILHRVLRKQCLNAKVSNTVSRKGHVLCTPMGMHVYEHLHIDMGGFHKTLNASCRTLHAVSLASDANKRIYIGSIFKGNKKSFDILKGLQYRIVVST